MTNTSIHDDEARAIFSGKRCHSHMTTSASHKPLPRHRYVNCRHRNYPNWGVYLGLYIPLWGWAPIGGISFLFFLFSYFRAQNRENRTFLLDTTLVSAVYRSRCGERKEKETRRMGKGDWAWTGPLFLRCVFSVSCFMFHVRFQIFHVSRNQRDQASGIFTSA